MSNPYQIQSEQQKAFFKALSQFKGLIVRPGNPPIAFELMGQVSIQHLPAEDKLLITSPDGIRQLLSVLWSEFRLCRLDPELRTLQLSNGQYLILQITHPDHDLTELIPLLGQMMDLPRKLPQATKLDLGKGWYLSDINPRDRSAYIFHLNDPMIYRYTMNIPYPYTPDDADQWMAYVDSMQILLNGPCNLAIRNPDHELCGGIGFMGSGSPPAVHQTEIGYWLAKPYWGQGIMSEAVKVFSQWAFERYQFQRLFAHVFTENTASEKVLLKAGYQLEGHMTNHYLKDGRLYDGKLFARTAKTEPS